MLVILLIFGRKGAWQCDGNGREKYRVNWCNCGGDRFEKILRSVLKLNLCKIMIIVIIIKYL